MAVRTTSDDVKAILGRNYSSRESLDLTPFIVTASNLVDWVDGTCSPGTLTASTLELIERWLAAHFYAHADQLFSSKSTNGASGSFQGQTGMNLNSTQYGQTALSLDTTGCLSRRVKEIEQGGTNVVSLDWLGTEYTD